MKKNHIIKGFRVSKITYDLFSEASENTGIKKTDLSRLLFNRALKELKSTALKNGWENLSFSVKELS